MLRFLIDEDMPRSLAEVLRTKGFEVLDERDCGLRGGSDDEISPSLVTGIPTAT